LMNTTHQNITPNIWYVIDLHSKSNFISSHVLKVVHYTTDVHV